MAVGRQAQVTFDYGRPYVDTLVSAGLVERADGVLELTPGGGAAADRELVNR